MEYQNQSGRKPSNQGSPLYPPPVQRSKCRTAVVAVFRLFVALLALVMVALTIAGQVVPFCEWTDKKEGKTYSVWRKTKTKYKKMKVEQEAREDNTGERVFAVLSAIFAAVACVLCFVFVGLWARHEQTRRRETNAYRNAQRYAEEMQMIDQSSPHRNHHHSNNAGEDARRLASSKAVSSSYGSGEVLYQLERHRQRVDRDVGIAAVSLLMAASLTSLVTVALMSHFYDDEVADEVRGDKGESAEMREGISIFIAALVLGVVGFLVLSLPFATNLFLCCPPSVDKVHPTQQFSRSDSDDNDGRRGAPHVAYKSGGDGGAAVPGYRNDNVYVNNTYNTHNMDQSNNVQNTNNTNNTMNVHNSNNTHNSNSNGQGVIYPYSNNSGYGSNSYNASNNNNNFALSSGNSSSPPPARAMAPQAAMEHVAVEPLRDEQIAEPRASLMSQQLFFNSPQAEVRHTPQPPPALYGSGTKSKNADEDSNHYQYSSNSASGGAATKPPPQPYVPTVVGTYPEALPGPATMENVTLHQVAPNGHVGAATALPATQAAWRGSETTSDYVARPTQAAREGYEEVKKPEAETSKTKEVYESPVKRYYQ